MGCVGPSGRYVWQKLTLDITHSVQPNFFIPAMLQSLEFVVETRILAEVKIENRGKNFFLRKNKLQSLEFIAEMKMENKNHGKKYFPRKKIDKLFFFFFFLNSPSL